MSVEPIQDDLLRVAGEDRRRCEDGGKPSRKQWGILRGGVGAVPRHAGDLQHIDGIMYPSCTDRFLLQLLLQVWIVVSR